MGQRAKRGNYNKDKHYRMDIRLSETERERIDAVANYHNYSKSDLLLRLVTHEFNNLKKKGRL